MALAGEPVGLVPSQPTWVLAKPTHSSCWTFVEYSAQPSQYYFLLTMSGNYPAGQGEVSHETIDTPGAAASAGYNPE